MFCSSWFYTMHVVCKNLLCVVCIGLLPAEFFTVNTGLGKPTYVFHWKAQGLNRFLQTNNSLATNFLKQDSWRSKEEF